MSIRVLLADDHRLVREALRDALSREADIDVVGEAGDARRTLELARGLAPDVLVLDIGLPDLNGIEVASRLRDEGSTARVVVLSAYADKRFVTGMLRAGALAYVAKSSAGTELVRAIRAVIAGDSYFSPEIATAVASELRAGNTAGEPEPLGRREREVLRLIAEGERTPAIAARLHITVATVEVHRRNIMRKLDLHTIADLTRHAIREGIIAP